MIVLSPMLFNKMSSMLVLVSAFSVRQVSGSENSSTSLDTDSTSDVDIEALAIASLRMSAFSCAGVRSRRGKTREP